MSDFRSQKSAVPSVTFGDASAIVQASATAAKTLFSFVRMPQESA
jgi:hypothetical protein